ncbi:probable aminoacyl tRNA synthase complex-interacting multifunctional protein 2 isoform X1 [Diorhabda sublineata]|uniref:probable aminoacyl tRNA synthase complex-interacting multifunctional protein 2 isoform X1 n=1 Tax=Diorhabda sublineata TaxID=1163346 RepID=UPI0024E15932|nr:probable aminoacyl tRNA synthase complex-interacting multifunctional protein 2 isoform X1 [Diorhabda sublineata]
MNGPLKMYRTKPIIIHDQQMGTPKCMYSLINIHSKESKEIVGQSTDHVSTTNNSRIFDQVKQFLKSNHQIPGMAELEAKQTEILKQLDNLKKQIISIKLDLKNNYSSPVISQSAFSNSTSEKLSGLPNLVIKTSPTNPPHSLRILQKLLQDKVELNFTSHLHSSVSELTEDAKELEQSLINHNLKHNVPKLNIKLIWKNVGVNTELIVSRIPIIGEVNLIRYLTRIIDSSLSYSSDPNSVEIDSILDTCHQILRSKTKTERAIHLVTLNKSLGKAQWLGGRNSYSLGDIAAYSALKQASNRNEINANLSNWFQRCKNVL